MKDLRAILPTLLTAVFCFFVGTIVGSRRPPALVQPGDSSAQVAKLGAVGRAQRMFSVRGLRPSFDQHAVSAMIVQLSRQGVWRNSKRWNDLLESATQDELRWMLNELANLPQGSARAAMQADLLGRWSAVDPLGTIEYSRQTPNRRDRQAALAGVVQIWLENDFPSAVAWIKELPEGPERTQYLALAVSSVAGSDLSQAVTLYKSLPIGGTAQSGALREIVLRMAATDPNAATELLAQSGMLTLPIGTPAHLVIPQVAVEMARSGIPAALAWIDKLPEERLKGEARLALAGSWAGQDPQAAAKYFAAVTNAVPGLMSPLANIAGRWGQMDPSGALKYATNSFPAGSMQDSFVAGVIDGWAQAAPKAAAAYVAASASPTIQSRTVRGIVQQWALDDPAAVGAWIVKFPESDLKKEAIGALIPGWTTSDPAAVGNWGRTFPPGPTQDYLFDLYIRHLSISYPGLVKTLAVRETPKQP